MADVDIGFNKVEETSPPPTMVAANVPQVWGHESRDIKKCVLTPATWYLHTSERGKLIEVDGEVSPFRSWFFAKFWSKNGDS